MKSLNLFNKINYGGWQDSSVYNTIASQQERAWFKPRSD